MSDAYEGWAIVELMGHRRLAGQVSQAEQYGAVFLRLDVPGPDGNVATQFYGGGAVYCLTPCSEEAARAVALREQPAPVHAWELPRARERATGADDVDVVCPSCGDPHHGPDDLCPDCLDEP
jgi:rubrerythrin